MGPFADKRIMNSIVRNTFSVQTGTKEQGRATAAENVEGEQ
jgi:hypothetical protein